MKHGSEKHEKEVKSNWDYELAGRRTTSSSRGQRSRSRHAIPLLPNSTRRPAGTPALMRRPRFFCRRLEEKKAPGGFPEGFGFLRRSGLSGSGQLLAARTGADTRALEPRVR